MALTPGAHYIFYVEARNSVGYSVISDYLTVHAAQIPDKPSPPVTAVQGDNVVVTWDEPYTGSTPITNYVVKFESSDGGYVENKWICDGS